MFENSISSQPKCWKKALQACQDATRLHRLNLGLFMGGSLGWCRSGRTISAEASDMEWIRTGWWFQICFILTPTWGNDPIWLTNIFQMGWNHQLEKIHRPNFIFQPRCAWNNGISLPPFLATVPFGGPGRVTSLIIWPDWWNPGSYLFYHLPDVSDSGEFLQQMSGSGFWIRTTVKLQEGTSSIIFVKSLWETRRFMIIIWKG